MLLCKSLDFKDQQKLFVIVMKRDLNRRVQNAVVKKPCLWYILVYGTYISIWYILVTYIAMLYVLVYGYFTYIGIWCLEYVRLHGIYGHMRQFPESQQNYAAAVRNGIL